MDHALFEEKSSYCGRTSLATATTAMAAEETDVGIRQAHDFNGDVGSAVSEREATGSRVEARVGRYSFGTGKKAPWKCDEQDGGGLEDGDVLKDWKYVEMLHSADFDTKITFNPNKVTSPLACFSLFMLLLSR